MHPQKKKLNNEINRTKETTEPNTNIYKNNKSGNITKKHRVI